MTILHIDVSGSKGTPEQVILQGKQQGDTLISGVHSNALTGAL